jgi:hypothetical protein
MTRWDVIGALDYGPPDREKQNRPGCMGQPERSPGHAAATPASDRERARHGLGILTGMALTFALNNVVAKWAAGDAHDPVVLLAGTLILVLVAGIACAIPALRASHVDPMTTLRCE